MVKESGWRTWKSIIGLVDPPVFSMIVNFRSITYQKKKKSLDFWVWPVKAAAENRSLSVCLHHQLILYTPSRTRKPKTKEAAYSLLSSTINNYTEEETKEEDQSKKKEKL